MLIYDGCMFSQFWIGSLKKRENKNISKYFAYLPASGFSIYIHEREKLKLKTSLCVNETGFRRYIKEVYLKSNQR